MSIAAEVSAARAGASLFRLDHRGVIEVAGDDRTSWLDGMVSNDVAGLEPGPERSGCYATLLTPKGSIVADLAVLLRPDSYWLDLERDAVVGVIERLGRFVVADDVALRDCSSEFDRLGIEGPRTAELMTAATGSAFELAADACGECEIAGVPVVIAAFGWSGELACQLFVPAGRGEVVAQAILEVDGVEVFPASPAALEILRIESGTPRLGAELSEEILPAEANLERAISATKGCYVGQEIVARLRTRGRVNHFLVGLEFGCAEMPSIGASLSAGGRVTGEVTSVCKSPQFGKIGLGFVRREHAAPGTELRSESFVARVNSLPFGSTGATGSTDPADPADLTRNGSGE